MSLSLLRPSLRAIPRASVARSAVAACRHASTAPIPVSNIEAQWKSMTPEEQNEVHKALEQLQKKDWKQLSLDEKKAAYYVAFGPHGPRTPIVPPGSGIKVFFGVVGCIGVAGLIFAITRAFAPPPPRSMTREWQEATNEQQRRDKVNPFTGVASEGYKGKGNVQ
ncbi:cytochrome c oxidase subunit IV [Calocera cornea HHB12733]|uniref:Cytochrome c oxidase subunit IV n=1 Tax=Calocera cornea HHB12733 TaxID=1353952 RepID=A0A165J3Q5_9BASI|nr:cytochrome c oxidase subunit IV [Calocera cornea HHB12733]